MDHVLWLPAFGSAVACCLALLLLRRVFVVAAAAGAATRIPVDPCARKGR